MADRFDTTQWSMVLGACGAGSEAGRALESLCRTYRPPVLAFIRAQRIPLDEAEDLAQAFFAHLLEQRLPARADPARGRFRAFLKTALRNFIANEQRRERAQRRGGGRALLDVDELPVAGGEDPEAAFERAWAGAVLAEALRRLRAEAVQGGKLALFEQLRPFLLEATEAVDYAHTAEALGLRRNTLAVAVHRLRTRLQDLVRAVIADTVADAGQAELELRQIRAASEPVGNPRRRSG